MPCPFGGHEKLTISYHCGGDMLSPEARIEVSARGVKLVMRGVNSPRYQSTPVSVLLTRELLVFRLPSAHRLLAASETYPFIIYNSSDCESTLSNYQAPRWNWASTSATQARYLK